MAWEWVAPVAAAASGGVGVTFTWLAGHQSRKHLERMTKLTDDKLRAERLTQEKRDAYLGGLRLIRVELRRLRYERTGAVEKLEEVERTWPKGDRIRMTIDAVIAIDAFGSPAARDLAIKFAQVPNASDEEQMTSLYRKVVDLVRAELGTEALPAFTPAEATLDGDGKTTTSYVC